MNKLVADIGGTNVRFGIARPAGVDNIKVFSCNDYPTLADAANTYLETTKEKPEAGAFAVATPLDGSDRVTMTNHAWDFSITDTRARIGLKDLRVINDFAALALSVPYLGEKDRYQVGGGTAEKNMPIGIIGPGTGLGVAGVVFAEDGKPIPISTEGGHVTMPAATAREFALFEYLRWTKYRHVSAERVCSGKGLVNLYHAIVGVDGLALPDKEAAEIAAAALERSCKACDEALGLFCHFLGIVAGNLALTYGAKGGIYIAGGIVPKLGDYFPASRFRESFEAKGRFKEYVARIPAYVVTHPYPGLEGLRRID
jgi:glucokinase